MTDSPELLIEIIEIEPEAVYKETIYDQTVIARLQSGAEITLFDSSASVKKDDVGDILNVFVYAFPKSHGEKKVSDKNIGIYPPENPSTKWSHDCIGEIIGIDLDEGTLVLDIGSGDISVKLYDNTKQILESTEAALGDCLYIPDCRMDIFKLIDSNKECGEKWN